MSLQSDRRNKTLVLCNNKFKRLQVVKQSFLFGSAEAGVSLGNRQKKKKAGTLIACLHLLLVQEVQSSLCLDLPSPNFPSYWFRMQSLI